MCGKISFAFIFIYALNGRGEEGQPQQFLVRATFSSFSRPSHLEILVLWLSWVLKFLILEEKTIFFKSGNVRAKNMDRQKYCNDYIMLESLKPWEWCQALFGYNLNLFCLFKG